MRIFALLRSLFYATLFVWLWTWLVPRWIGIRGEWHAADSAPWRWLGLIPAVVGAAGVLWCIIDFSFAGHGTPAPFDAPRRFVARGPYRYVRNPMYLSFGCFLIGVGILFAHWSWTIAVYAVALILIVNLFVLLYEEPALRAKFGEEYDAYCAGVPRWTPRPPR
jgi:protein-S-isoprenylcysteine O-methyltransferase Ste14